MNQQEFVELVVQISREKGYRIEVNRLGQTQIDFGNKKLHSDHLARLFPEILSPNADVAKLIDTVAPGRPCTHRPMREIVADLTETES